MLLLWPFKSLATPPRTARLSSTPPALHAGARTATAHRIEETDRLERLLENGRAQADAAIAERDALRATLRALDEAATAPPAAEIGATRPQRQESASAPASTHGAAAAAPADGDSALAAAAPWRNSAGASRYANVETSSESSGPSPPPPASPPSPPASALALLGIGANPAPGAAVTPAMPAAQPAVAEDAAADVATPVITPLSYDAKQPAVALVPPQAVEHKACTPEPAALQLFQTQPSAAAGEVPAAQIAGPTDEICMAQDASSLPAAQPKVSPLTVPAPVAAATAAHDHATVLTPPPLQAAQAPAAKRDSEPKARAWLDAPDRADEAHLAGGVDTAFEAEMVKAQEAAQDIQARHIKDTVLPAEAKHNAAAGAAAGAACERQGHVVQVRPACSAGGSTAASRHGQGRAPIAICCRDPVGGAPAAACCGLHARDRTVRLRTDVA